MFMNPKGFHYYTPVFLLWMLDQSLETDSNLPESFFEVLDKLPHDSQAFSLFTKNQREAISSFYRHLAEQGCEESRKALERRWNNI